MAKISNTVRTREENIAAISAVFHQDERYNVFYIENQEAFSGFPGILQFMVKAGKAFTKVEFTLKNVWDNYDWIEAIDKYVDELFNLDAPADEDIKSLYKWAKTAIKSA